MIFSALLFAAVELTNSLDMYQPEEFFDFTNTVGASRMDVGTGAYNAPENIVGSSCNYVRTITNAWSAGEWKLFRNGSETNGVPVPEFQDDFWPGWLVRDSILEHGQDVEASPEYVGGGKMAWQIGPWYAVSNGVRLAKYRADREIHKSEDESDSWGHKGMPTNKETFDTLYNTFGGFLERIYYASQGPSNSWDVAQYGQRDRRHFKPGSIYQEMWDYKPTNRTVSTRRFFDVENVLGLREQFRRMIPAFCSTDRASFSDKPGWLVDHEEDRHHLWWSSSTLPCAVWPSAFDWKEHPLEDNMTNSWNRSSGCLGHCNRVVTNGTITTGAPAIWPDILGRMLFERDPERDRLRLVQPPYLPTLRDVVTNSFPHAVADFGDACSYRLFPDDLAYINQLLFLMDTTYHVPPIGSYTNGLKKTSISKLLTRYAEAKAKIVVTQDGYALDRVIKADELSWHTSTNTVDVRTETIPGLEDREQVRVGPTTTDLSGPFCAGVGGGAWELLADESLVRALTQWVGDDDDFELFINLRLSFQTDVFPPNLFEEVSFSFKRPSDDEWDSYSTTMSVYPDVPDEISLYLTEGCQREYSHAEKVYRRLDFGPTQPGWQARPTHIASASAAFFSGIHELRGLGVPTTEYTIPYADGYSKTFYKLYPYPFASPSQLRQLVLDTHLGIRTRMEEDMKAFCGGNPLDHSSYLPIGDDIFANVNEATTFGSVSASFSFQLGNNFEIEARITHGRVSNYIIRNDYGETVDDKVIASFKVSVEGVTDGEPARPSGYRDHPAFAADGLFEFATQVKWDWLSIKEFKEEE